MTQQFDNSGMPRPTAVGTALYRLAIVVLLGSIALSQRDMAKGIHIMGRNDVGAIDVNIRGGVNANVGGWVDVKERE